jgi:type II secretory pathway pseudopilin PulG
MNARKQQRGLTIVEALVAFAILAVGLLALVGLHGSNQRELGLARARAEASALAEQKLHELQSFVDLGDIPLNDPGSDAVNGVAAFARRWEVSRPADDGSFGDAPASVLLAEVTVDWTDSLGNDQSVAVASELVEAAPTRDAVRLLAALEATEASWGTASWEVDDEEDEDSTSDSDSDSEEDSDAREDCSEDECDYEGYNNRTRYTVSGDLDGDRNKVDGIEGSGNGDTDISCSLSGGSRNFTCETDSLAAGATWSGEIEFDLDDGRRLCSDEFGVVIRDRDTLVIDGLSGDSTINLSVRRSCPRKVAIDGTLSGDVNRVRKNRGIGVREEDPGSANMACWFVVSNGFRCESEAFDSDDRWEGELVFSLSGKKTRLCESGGSVNYEVDDKHTVAVEDVESGGTIQLEVAKKGCSRDD